MSPDLLLRPLLVDDWHHMWYGGTEIVSTDRGKELS
jgi:hypothetical protein